MQTAPIHVHPPGALLALLGNPNCGKTALFNLLTGSSNGSFTTGPMAPSIMIVKSPF